MRVNSFVAPPQIPLLVNVPGSPREVDTKNGKIAFFQETENAFTVTHRRRSHSISRTCTTAPKLTMSPKKRADSLCQPLSRHEEANYKQLLIDFDLLWKTQNSVMPAGAPQGQSACPAGETSQETDLEMVETSPSRPKKRVSFDEITELKHLDLLPKP